MSKNDDLVKKGGGGRDALPPPSPFASGVFRILKLVRGRGPARAARGACTCERPSPLDRLGRGAVVRRRFWGGGPANFLGGGFFEIFVFFFFGGPGIRCSATVPHGGDEYDASF